MAGEILSTNMNLPVPTPGVTSGPVYATDINNCLTIIDGHDHTTGFGVLITPAAMDINSDLSFNNYNLINLRTTTFQIQDSPLSNPTDSNCLFVSGVDLYYNDGTNTIRVTSGGSVNAGAGSIGGLPSGTASVTYSSGQYIFEQSTGIRADIDALNYILRNNISSSAALILSPPNSMSSDYTLVLPSLPGSQKIMTLDASGNMSAPYVVDNSTIEISSNTIRVKPNGITTNEIAPNTIVAADIASNTITGNQITNTLVLGGTLTVTGLTTLNAAVNIAGLLTVDDDLTVTNSINATIAVSAGGHMEAPFYQTPAGRRLPATAAVPSAGTNLVITRGAINTAGVLVSGEGFTSSKITTGHYRITYNYTSSSQPCVTVTAGASDIDNLATVFSSIATSVDIKISRSNILVDSDFNFISIGSI